MFYPVHLLQMYFYLKKTLLGLRQMYGDLLLLCPLLLPKAPKTTLCLQPL